MASIYGLLDSEGNLRYIGKAINPLARLKGHMRDVARRRTPLYDWLRVHGLPTMIVLEDGCADWKVSEREWIAAARLSSAPILNLADGGDQPGCSPETRSANGHALVARLKADPNLAKLRDLKRSMSTALRKGQVMNKTRAKLRYLARADPACFGQWTDLPDREENADGSPLGGY